MKILLIILNNETNGEYKEERRFQIELEIKKKKIGKMRVIDKVKKGEKNENREIS